VRVVREEYAAMGECCMCMQIKRGEEMEMWTVAQGWRFPKGLVKIGKVRMKDSVCFWQK